MLPTFTILIIMSMTALSQTNLSLTGSQSYTSDWKLGERRAFDFAINSTGKYNFRIDTLQLTASYKVAGGVMLENSSKYDDSRILPTDNEIFLESVLKYPLGWKLDPYFSFNMRTQITESIQFAGNNRRVNANFWDPIITQEAFGFGMNLKNNKINNDMRLGASLMQVRAQKHTTMTDDRKTPEIVERYKSIKGIEFVNQVQYFVDKKTNINSKFSALGNIDDFKVWIIRFENELKVEIWKYLGILMRFDLIYDQNQMMELQIYQSMRFGFITKLS